MAGRPVVVLAGGTGGAKLARGVLDIAGHDLVVVANTGDDVEIYGGHVSPDPDLVLYWLADRIDERGWGLRDDTFQVMEGLREIGSDPWFSLGDRDLAVALQRRRRLQEGARLTDALAELGASLGVGARVLPMSDDPVRTRVRHRGRWWPFQEYMIVAEAQGPVEEVRFEGAERAGPSDEVLAAVAGARAILIGPSNPVASIGPILALHGMREALRAAPAPVIAVSPIVGGRVVKGPTDPFMRWAGHEPSASGVAATYAGVIDGLVADEAADGIPVLEIDTLMTDAESRRRVAEATLGFAAELARE
ncbi:MAG: 2-phospho-L-lactate transferase [Solirubrobacteraceae bacterium]